MSRRFCETWERPRPGPPGHRGVQFQLMMIELGVSPRALFALFDGKEVSSGMSREVPGGATIQMGTMMERRDFSSIQATAFVPILLTFGSTMASGVAVKLIADFLTEKLKGQDKARRMMTINRRLVEVTTSEAIVKMLEETIEIKDPDE
jgi:hypothetical protein